MRLVSVALCLLAGAAGCSLVIGTEGLAGEAPGPTPYDAAAFPDGLDASLDGAQGTDGAAVVDGAALRGCGLYADASFCQDFDDPTTALSASTWTSADTAGPAGTITLVEAGAASQPNAARLALLDASNGCESLPLSKQFQGARSALKMRVAVRADGLGTFLAVVAAPSATPGNSYRVLLAFEKPGSSTGYLSAFVQKHDASGFINITSNTLPFTSDPVGKDFVVGVEITAAPSASIIVREGGRALTLTAPSDLTIVDARVDLGPYCQAVARTFTFDDLAIWTTP